MKNELKFNNGDNVSSSRGIEGKEKKSIILQGKI